jgi:hypothetical protein
MGAGATGSQVIHADNALKPRVSLISNVAADADIRFSDIAVLPAPAHDVYGLSSAHLITWQLAIALVANTLVNTTTPAHVATEGLMVSYLKVDWNNVGNPAGNLHIFLSYEDENG